MKKILFITHEATATGAPKVLYLFLQWMQQNHPEVERHVVCLQAGGKLKEAFEQVAHAYHIFPTNKYQKKTFLEKVMAKLGWHTPKKSTVEVWQDLLVANQYDIIYANTIVTLPFANQMKERLPKAKLVCHVHEMKTVMKLLLPNISEYQNSVDQWIAVSTPVKNDLISFSLNEKKISLVYEFSNFKNDIVIESNKSKFIVGSCGAIHWRKGYDFFIQVARYINKYYPEINKYIEFLWVGSIDDFHKLIIYSDITKLELVNLKFVGEQNNPYDLFQQMDVFLLTSREDPFPLVAIEVAGLKKPILCFDKATGSSEIIRKINPNNVVNYLDIEEMAERVVFYFKNKDSLEVDGIKYQQEFISFSVEEQAPKIFDLLN